MVLFGLPRLEWESAILRGCATFRRMEQDRLEQLRALADTYQVRKRGRGRRRKTQRQFHQVRIYHIYIFF